MLMIDDIAAIPLFSALPTTELERLARTSADVRLSAGEFAVHEGGDALLRKQEFEVERRELVEIEESALGLAVTQTAEEISSNEAPDFR